MEKRHAYKITLDVRVCEVHAYVSQAEMVGTQAALIQICEQMAGQALIVNPKAPTELGITPIKPRIGPRRR